MKIRFMNNDIKLFDIDERARYSLTNCVDHSRLYASVIFRPQYVSNNNNLPDACSIIIFNPW